MLRDIVMLEDHCPVCGYLFDPATGVNTDGDPTALTVCLQCTAVLKWDPAMRLRLMSDEELRELPTDVLVTLQRVQHALLELKVKASMKNIRRLLRELEEAERKH